MDAELKQLHKSIEASEEEMTSLRTKLSQQLPARRNFPWGTCLLVAAAIVILAIFSRAALMSPEHRLNQETSGQLLALISQSQPEELKAMAEACRQDPSPLIQANALAILFHLQQGDAVMQAATEGIQVEQRSELRILYLEHMLDEADHYWFHTSKLEDLLDRETNPVCIKLLESLIRLNSKTFSG